MVESILSYIPLISVTIVSALLVIAFLNFSTMRRNMLRQTEQQINNLKVQTEQQIYSQILELRLKLENTDEFTRMAKESTVFRDRFGIVESPTEYYIIVSFLDLFEYVFHLNKTQMIDDLVWKRWKILMQTVMTIPKFNAVWTKTRDSHPDEEFREFTDSLSVLK